MTVPDSHTAYKTPQEHPYIDISREFGLEINKCKRKILIYNLDNPPDHIEGMQVVDEIIHPGIIITNNRNIFHKQENNDRKRTSTEYYGILYKSEKLPQNNHRKNLLENICLPLVLYGDNIMNFTEKKRDVTNNRKQCLQTNIGSPKVCTKEHTDRWSPTKIKVIACNFGVLHRVMSSSLSS